ncbi:hypothetical protein CAFE_18530 [Caprobacter fermentans]|uniref:Uncharacterized protein n=1 Tax=Caproicibacter fermentans TaxID=2576756 RepID=A0A6N8HZR6_9FIRM|nr:hypothetical protein [Caproicibacter fermentans]MVB11148.1 hypothetical protein [Caproicibacter fermentans]
MPDKKLLVSKSSVDLLREALADARADCASEYINGYGDGIEYALKMLGLKKEAKS